MSLPEPMGPIEGIFSPPVRSIAGRVLTALLLTFAVILVGAAIKLYHNIDAVRAADSDNKVWNIVQFEVDYRDLTIAALQAQAAAETGDHAAIVAGVARLRLEFDIFYSRINALFATLHSSMLAPDFAAEMEQLTAARLALATRIDGLSLDQDLVAALDGLRTQIGALNTVVRRLSVDALQRLITRTETARLQERRLLATMFGASIALILLTIVSVMLSIRLGRSQAAAETRIGRSTALTKAAFESAVTAMLVCDAQGRILLTNPAAGEMFGHTHADLQGHSLHETLIPQERLAEYRRFLRFIRATGESGDATIGPVQVSAQRADGEVFPAAVLVRITKVDADQRLILVFVQDISEQVESESRLQHAAEEARRYATAQRRFLATMSHELRTPLHGVRAALDLLKRQSLPASAIDLVEIAQQSCTHALQQTDSALDAIRSTQENEAIVVFDPVSVTKDLTAEMGLIGKATGTEISLEVTGDGPRGSFMGRPRAFGRAMGNLIANATKYAPGGQIIVRLAFGRADANGQAILRAEVIDDGPGIPQDRLDRIFEPFNHDLLPEQKHDSGGFGLGLSIVKQAVSVMGGEITVTSDRGRGCHVTFSVPLIPVAGAMPALPSLPQEAARPAHLHHAQGKAALGVDDARVNCALVAQMLGELGYAADTAFSGQEAIGKAATKAYALILMDFYMPGITGPEAAAGIRLAGASAQATIIGITARVDLMGSAAGAPPDMDRVLFKPFGLAELEACLTQGAAQPTMPDVVSGSDELDLLRATLEMCGEALGMALLHDTLALAMQALAEMSQDPAICAETAHRAAGAAMMAGFHELGSALRAVEQAARTNPDKAALAPLHARLASATQKARATLGDITAAQQHPRAALVD